MIDTTFVKEHYARMSNEELVHLADCEGQQLTPEAWTVLQEELQKRGVNTNLLETTTNTQLSQEQLQQRQAQASVDNNFLASSWEYVFNAKKTGASNENIQKALLERGMEPNQAAQLLRALPNQALLLAKAANSSLQKDGLICGLGLAVSLFTYLSATNGGTYVVAWGAVVFGGIRFLQAWNQKTKFQKIVAIIEKEQKSPKDIL